MPSKLAIVWFAKSEIAKATTIVALSVPLGAIVGMALPAFLIGVVINEKTVIDDKLWAECVKQLKFYCLI